LIAVWGIAAKSIPFFSMSASCYCCLTVGNNSSP
jgi:hypothetical protein